MTYVELCHHLLGFHFALHLKTFKASYENAANGLTSKQGTHEKGKQRLERKTKKYSRMGTTRRHSRSEVSEANLVSDSDERFGFYSGSDFTLEEIQKHTDSFRNKEC